MVIKPLPASSDRGKCFVKQYYPQCTAIDEMEVALVHLIVEYKDQLPVGNVEIKKSEFSAVCHTVCAS